MSDPFLDATAQAELVRRGDVSALELVEEAVARIEKINAEINAVIVPLYDKARAEAAVVSNAAPFAGVPYVLKDITMHSKGDPYAAGIAGMRASGYRSDHDSWFVERMREAGFILVGKSNTPEMALYESTEPAAWGPTRNPWDTARSTGGSSGGSAAAVAAGLVPIAHGNDGGGSIRMPASQCGVVGLKPTRGRVSVGPLVVESDTVSGMAVDGFLTRSVRDQAAALDIVSGHRPGDAYCAPTPRRPFLEEVGADPGCLRIGVLTHDPTGQLTVDAECASAARVAADVLSDLGHDVADGYPEVLKSGHWPTAFYPCIGVVVARELDWLGEQIGRPITAEDVEPTTWGYVELGRSVSGIDHAAGIDALRNQAREIERWWEQDGWDLLLTPTIPVPTPKLKELEPDPDDPTTSLAVWVSHFTVLFNTSGQPAISLPLGHRSDGMPIGVQLAAAYGREDLLFRVASQLEQATPWAHRRPPVSA